MIDYYYNVVHAEDEDSEEEPDESDYCTHCRLKLDYLIDEDVSYCRECGYNIPEKLLINPQNNKAAAAIANNDDSSSSSNDDGPAAVLTGGDSSLNGEDIHIVSWSKPRSQEYKDDLLRKDGVDDYLRNILKKSKGTLVSSAEYIASSDSR